MATTTPQLGLQLPADGEMGWAAMYRNNFSKLDQVSAGQNLLKTLTGGTYILSATEDRCDSFEFQGALTANQVVIIPNNMPPFVVENLMTGNFTLTIKTATGAGLVIDQGTKVMAYANGTNCEYIAGAQRTQVISIAGGTRVVTPLELAGGSIEITGVLTSNAIIIVPNTQAPFTIEDTTTGNFTVTVKTAAGIGFVLPLGICLAYCNGVNCEFANGTIAGQLVSLAATVVSAVASTPTKVSLTGAAFNNDGLTLDTVNSRITCVNPGVYHFIGHAGGACTAAIQAVSLQGYKNGVLIPAANAPADQVNNPTAAANNFSLTIDFCLRLVAGDFVELYAAGTVASGMTLAAGKSSLSARKL